MAAKKLSKESVEEGAMKRMASGDVYGYIQEETTREKRSI